MCYAGIPCPESVVPREDAMAVTTIAVEDEGKEYRSRFVCGTSYERATASCGAADSLEPSNDGGGLFCPTGLSGECPVGTSCYAGVLCPVRGSASDAVETEKLIAVDERSTRNSTDDAETLTTAAKGYYLSDVVVSTSKLLSGFFQGRSPY